VIELDWSKQSPHIRTLFRPWQPGDGYDEATLRAAEVRLGLRLPTLLCTFYSAWGRREDLTEPYHHVQALGELEVEADTLIFCVGELFFWGIRRKAWEEDDPPVVMADAERRSTSGEAERDWSPSYAHLSRFLDDLIYDQAFSGGALHGGWKHPPAVPALPLVPELATWLGEQWSAVSVGPLALHMVPDPTVDQWPRLYVRDGQAFWWVGGGEAAAREAEALDELSQRFQMTWDHRW